MVYTVRSLTVLLITALLAACSQEQPPAADVARCILDGSDLQQVHEFGESGARSAAPTLGRTAGIGCPGALALALDEAYRTQIAQAVHAAAEGRVEYRQGRYAAVLPASTPQLVRARVSELGALLEDVQATRRDVLSCGEVDATAIAFVSQLDGTFALAAMGRYVGVDDFQQAKQAAAALLEKTGEGAALVPAASCDAKLHYRYRTQVQQWSKFFEGQHAWAPGCSVKTEPDSFVLTCK